MVSTAGTTVSVLLEWRFPNAGLRGHRSRNIHPALTTFLNSFILEPLFVFIVAHFSKKEKDFYESILLIEDL